MSGGLADIKKTCLVTASFLPKSYMDYDITELADGYCDATDEFMKDKSDAEASNKRDMYISALILRFWYTINKMYQACKTANVEIEDLYFRLFSCIDAACQYRAWRNPEKHTNAQACINQVIASRGAAYIMYESNLKKNKNAVNVISLDAAIDSDDDDSDSKIDQLVDPNYAIERENNRTFSLIQDFIDDNKIVEAIILDNIATQDVFKHDKKTVTEIDEITGEEKKYVKETSEFWPFQLVKNLNSLDEQYAEYFSSMYEIPAVKLKVALDALHAANNAKKYKMLKSTLNTARKVFSY